MNKRRYDFGRMKFKPFESTWKTDNAGVSTSTQIKLPLISTGTYSFSISWGDGTSDTITAWNQAQTLHTYSIAGTYNIKISGTCVGWQFNNTGDKLKMISVKTWGKLKLGTNQGRYFYGCTNLNLSSVEDILDLTGTTSLQFAFTSMTTSTINRINEWDFSQVNTMAGTFESMPNFNSDIGNINVSNVLSFASTFNNCAKFNRNLNNWSIINALTLETMFQNAIVFNNGLASGVAGNMTWSTSSTNLSTNSMFKGATSFNQNVGSLNVSNVLTFLGMFQGAIKFNNGGSNSIGNWTLKTTGSINMTSVFQGASIFNQSLNSWNTIAVTTIASIFESAIAFNNGLASGVGGTMTWNTGNISSMARAFFLTNSFNQNISSWNVFNVLNYTQTFGSSIFNNGLASGVSGVMSWTINNSPSSSVTFSSTFSQNGSFNQDISSWDMSRVVSLNSTFNAASKFNQNIGSLNVSNVNDFSFTFQGATIFNNGGSSSIGGWNTGSGTQMVRTFGGILAGAVAFNQNIGSWNVSNVNDFTGFMEGKTPANFSTTNLDAIYNSATGWASRSVKPNLTISFGSAKYTIAGQAGRDILDFAPNNWTITDGGI